MHLSAPFVGFLCSDRVRRSLRGGSGGGGSSGGSSGGGYVGNNSSGINNSDLGLPGIIITSILFALFFCCPFLFICCHIQRKRRGEVNTHSDKGKAAFQSQVAKAKMSVEQSPRTTLSYERVIPHSGEYTLEYKDRAMTRTGGILLKFQDNGTDGYTISGDGHDADGSTNIEEGHANYDGTAWWREINVSGDVGMQVLSTGTFDFSSHTFEGEWKSSTQVSGKYVSFWAKDAPENLPSVNITTAANVPVSNVAPAPSAPAEDADAMIDQFMSNVSDGPSKY